MNCTAHHCPVGRWDSGCRWSFEKGREQLQPLRFSSSSNTPTTPPLFSHISSAYITSVMSAWTCSKSNPYLAYSSHVRRANSPPRIADSFAASSASYHSDNTAEAARLYANHVRVRSKARNMSSSILRGDISRQHKVWIGFGIPVALSRPVPLLAHCSLPYLFLPVYFVCVRMCVCATRGRFSLLDDNNTTSRKKGRCQDPSLPALSCCQLHCTDRAVRQPCPVIPNKVCAHLRLSAEVWGRTGTFS